MKKISVTSCFLLGFIFSVFGLNGFLHFIPTPPPQGLGGQFMGALFMSGELYVIMGIQLIAGALLLANRYVPLALALVAPVVANILFFHVFMDRSGLPVAVVVSALWLVAFQGVREAFSGIFVARSNPGRTGATSRQFISTGVSGVALVHVVSKQS
jgi:putative oxidoreductase